MAPKKPNQLDAVSLPLLDDDILIVQRGTDDVTKVAFSELGGGARGRIDCGEDISGHMLIVSIDGLAYLADPTDSDHASALLGVTLGAATTGNAIQYTAIGDIDSGAFSPNETYFAGLSGTLSTTPIAIGAVWMVKVGYAKTDEIISVNMDPSIIIE